MSKNKYETMSKILNKTTASWIAIVNVKHNLDFEHQFQQKIHFYTVKKNVEKWWLKWRLVKKLSRDGCFICQIKKLKKKIALPN